MVNNEMPHYIKEVIEKERREEERKLISAKVLYLDENTQMEFKDQVSSVELSEFISINSDEYIARVVKYAKRWAKYMQYRLGMGEHLSDIVASAYKDADVDGSISGYAHLWALMILCKTWKYGEELRECYRDQKNQRLSAHLWPYED